MLTFRALALRQSESIVINTVDSDTVTLETANFFRFRGKCDVVKNAKQGKLEHFRKTNQTARKFEE